jgi:hypothetical protein
MARKGRRLKRFLGLRRAAGSSTQGGIEHMLPGRILGWAAGNSLDFQEVRLLVGPHLIARAEINQPRPDVCEQIGRQVSPGFSLMLPSELPPLDWDQGARLLALTADGSHQAELTLMRQPKETGDRLLQLLQSEALGLEGHFDGLVDGALQGWAARRGQRQVAQIWLQTQGQEPVSIRCDQWRDGMAHLQMPDQCGFRLSLNTLPTGWAGRSVWCSFDHDGNFRIPQDKDVLTSIATTRRASDTEIIDAIATSYRPQIEASSEDLRSHWQALEEFRLFLDKLEQELNRRDQLKGMQQLQQHPKKHWLRQSWRPRLN